MKDFIRYLFAIPFLVCIFYTFTLIALGLGLLIVGMVVYEVSDNKWEWLLYMISVHALWLGGLKVGSLLYIDSNGYTTHDKYIRRASCTTILAASVITFYMM